MASVLKVDTIKSLTGNEAITISESGVPLLNVPAFRASYSSGGSLGTTAQVAVPINTIEFDTNSYFDISTYRYTPLIAGYYMFICTTSVTLASSSFFTVSLYKNGAADTTLYISRDITSNSQTGSGSAIVYMNGTTDYVESYARSVGAGGTGTWSFSSFSGFLVRGA